MSSSDEGISRRQFLATATTLAALAVLPGCARDTDSTSTGVTVRGGVLRFQINNPSYIDPYNVADADAVQVCRALFDTLVMYDYERDMIIPLAADSWSMSDDATQFDFHLREGALFHNGETVTASSFKYAWERLANPQTSPDNPSLIVDLVSPVLGYDEFRSQAVSEIEGIQAIDDYDLQVTLSSPYPEFIYICAHPGLSPVPSVASDLSTFVQSPVGNGPFKMNGSWVDGEHIRTITFSSYTGVKPIINGIDFLIFKDDSTAYSEFQAGNLDFAAVPYERMGEVRKVFSDADEGMSVKSGPAYLDASELAVCSLWLNQTNSSLSNGSFRKAISLAIDRDAICDVLTSNICTAASDFVPPDTIGFASGGWDHCRYDQQAAQDALSEAGYPNGDGAPRLTLSCDSNSLRSDIMKLIQSDLAAIGIQSDISSDNWITYRNNLLAGNYQLAILSWMSDAPTYDSALARSFSTASKTNYANYHDDTFEALLVAARAELDEAKRMVLYRDLDSYIGSSVPAAPLFVYSHHHVAASRVRGLFYGPDSVGRFESTRLSE